MSFVSPVAIRARSNSSAVATTKASTACLDESPVRLSSDPARCAMTRVSSQTAMPRPVSSRLTALVEPGAAAHLRQDGRWNANQRAPFVRDRQESRVPAPRERAPPRRARVH